jgi:hypothetical protein
MIERLQIENIRAITDRWQMSKGVCELPMGPISGKTTWVNAWTALLLEKHELLPASKGQSSIDTAFRLSGQCFDIRRSWLDGKPVEWSVTSDFGEWNLLDGGTYRKWQEFYCNLHIGETADVSRQDNYSAIVIAPVVRSISDAATFAQVFNRQLVPAGWSLIADRLEELYWSAYDRAVKGRQRDASKVEQAGRMERIQKDLAQIDLELSESLEARQRLEKRCEEAEHRFRQRQRMYEFIAQARSEVRRLEYEESRYREAMDNDSITDGDDGSRDGYERFQSLERQIHALEARQIENRHYEKNLRGLQDEVARLDASPETGERAAIYREEIDRLQAAIRQNATDDSLLDKLVEERERYRVDAEKHHFIEHRRKAGLSWDRETLEQQLTMTRRKLEAARAELGGLDADVVVSRYEDERRALRQWRQQIVELTARIDSIVHRRLMLLERRSTGSANELPSTASIDTKKLLDLTRKGLSALNDRQRQTRLVELLDLKKYFPENWSATGEYFSRVLSDTDFHVLSKISHTERLLLSILLQAAVARCLYRVPFCILPEHTAWLLPRAIVYELHRWLETIGFEQIIMFVPPAVDPSFSS